MGGPGGFLARYLELDECEGIMPCMREQLGRYGQLCVRVGDL